MYKYKLWGADVESDIELVFDDATKRKFVEAKMEVDRTDTVTNRFVVRFGRLQAHPASIEQYNSIVIGYGGQLDYYETDF